MHDAQIDSSAPSLAIVDGHALIVAGLAAVVQGCPHLRLAGRGADAAQAVALFEALQPQLMLIGLNLGGGGAVEAIARIRASHPRARLIVLSERDGDAEVARALAAGAAAALRKSADFAAIIACIEAVLAGRHMPAASPPLLQPEGRLSPRELDILRHLSAGNSNKVIARIAGIGVGTVKYHVNNILAKLNVSCRTQAASVAIQRGLVHFA